LDWIITTGAPWTQNQMEDSNFMKSWKLIIQKKKKIYIYIYIYINRLLINKSRILKILIELFKTSYMN